MIVESGVIIFVGLLLLGLKLPPWLTLRLLSHSFALDLAVSVLAFLMHMGTFSGVMAAAVAGLMCSAFTSIAKRVFGVIHHGRYFPGIVTIDPEKLRPPSTPLGKLSNQL